MDLDKLLKAAETINNLGSAVGEQLVTVVEAGDSDSIGAEVEGGAINMNALIMIKEALRDVRMELDDDDEELRQEITELLISITQVEKERT